MTRLSEYKKYWGPVWKNKKPADKRKIEVNGHILKFEIPNERAERNSMKNSKIKYKLIYDKIKDLVKDDDEIKTDEENLPLVNHIQYALLIIAAFEELEMKWTKSDKIWFKNLHDIIKTPYVAVYPMKAFGKGKSFSSMKNKSLKNNEEKKNDNKLVIPSVNDISKMAANIPYKGKKDSNMTFETDSDSDLSIEFGESLGTITEYYKTDYDGNVIQDKFGHDWKLFGEGNNTKIPPIKWDSKPNLNFDIKLQPAIWNDYKSKVKTGLGGKIEVEVPKTEWEIKNSRVNSKTYNMADIDSHNMNNYGPRFWLTRPYPDTNSYPPKKYGFRQVWEDDNNNLYIKYNFEGNNSFIFKEYNELDNFDDRLDKIIFKDLQIKVVDDNGNIIFPIDETNTTSMKAPEGTLPNPPSLAISSASISQDNDLPPGWTKQMSKKKNKEYYFNSITGESTWKKPTGGKKTKRNLLKIKNKTMRK